MTHLKNVTACESMTIRRVAKLYEGEIPEPACDQDDKYDSGHDNADDTHDGGDRHFCAGWLEVRRQGSLERRKGNG